MIISHYIVNYIDDSVKKVAADVSCYVNLHAHVEGLMDVGGYIAVICSNLEALVEGIPTLRSHVISSLDKSEKAISRRTETLWKVQHSCALQSSLCSYALQRSWWSPYRMSIREQALVCQLNEWTEKNLQSGGEEGRSMVLSAP